MWVRVGECGRVWVWERMRTYFRIRTSFGSVMKNECVHRIVLNWLFECYEPPYVPPAPVEGAEFDPTDTGREQWKALLEALNPPPRPHPLRSPLIWVFPGTEGLTESDLEATLE